MRPCRHDHQRADHHPKGDGSEPQPVPGMDEGVARGPPPAGGVVHPAIAGMAGLMVEVVVVV